MLEKCLLALIVILSSGFFSKSWEESSTCIMVYKEGGAPAVFQSPKCPRWTLPTMEDVRRQTPNCQSSMLQGRRAHQEDRTVCSLDMRIPFPGLHASLFPFSSINQLQYYDILPQGGGIKKKLLENPTSCFDVFSTINCIVAFFFKRK